jgi:hypothetical protein
MEPDLYKRHYFINQHKNKDSAFADDQVVIADSADNLQIGVFTLQNIATNSGMGKRQEKSGTIAFLGQDAVKFKIVVDNKCLQQLKNFKYLGCEIS